MADSNPLAKGFRKSEGKLTLAAAAAIAIPLLGDLLPYAKSYVDAHPQAPKLAFALSIVTAAYTLGRSYVAGKTIEADSPPMTAVNSPSVDTSAIK